MESITLYFKEGSSDKVYQVRIEPSGGKYLVNIAYGRRGATLQTGTKTPIAVEYDAAQVIYRKAVNSKQAKGYSPGEDATSYSTGSRRFTDVRPQLLNPLDEAGLERVVKSDAFVMEQKFDGRRLLLKKTGDNLIGINRRGIECGVPASIASTALRLPGRFLVDGEAVGDIFHVFDLLEADQTDWRPQPYRERVNRLSQLIGSEKMGAFHWVPREYWKVPKRTRLQQLREEGAEGVVFKRLAASYESGRPNSGGNQLKYKFVETASAVVTCHNTSRSVGLGVWCDAQLVPAGNVTIPPDHPVPPIGAIVEIRYLYAMPGSGALYQPVYRGERDDIISAECTRDQLKFRRALAEPDRE